jgi:glycosyltransferase involved in cell wall biosynthesis
LKKILLVVGHRRNRAPNQRFRIEQYIDFLESRGLNCDFSPLIASAGEDSILYSKNILKKIPLGIKLAYRRWRDVMTANSYDAIYIAREAFLTGSTFFERMLGKKTKVIFDFDDAIWINVVSENNKAFSLLKSAGKTSKIIALADLVIAGNEFLKQYAQRYNPNVVVIPTTIDTELYQPVTKVVKPQLVIGWSGSHSTIEHFKTAVPVLQAIKKKYGSAVTFKVIGDANYSNEALGIRGLPWRNETEVQDLNSFDIGIMPLPDNEWAWGKCGLKGLQYMALEVPTIMSPVGVNKDIINHGVNGFLASTEEEWVNCLSQLIENENLRVTLGKAGRETVIQHYSVLSQRENYATHFESVIRS